MVGKKRLAPTESSVDELEENSHRNSIASRLVNEMEFPEDLAVSAAFQGIATTLLRLRDENFQISESDPLLLLVVDISDNNSIYYANNGVYGLPAVALGSMPWPGGAPPLAGAPLPAGMAQAPPFALGKFIAAAPNVAELSNGGFNVFFVKDLESLHDIPGLLGAQPQFRRLGPGIAQMFAVAPHPQLVRFFTLDKISGPPREYRNFNQSP